MRHSIFRRYLGFWFNLVTKAASFYLVCWQMRIGKRVREALGLATEIDMQYTAFKDSAGGRKAERYALLDLLIETESSTVSSSGGRVMGSARSGGRAGVSRSQLS
jgi:hypothetical protein